MQNLLRDLSQESGQRWQRLLGNPGQPSPMDRSDPPAGFIFPYQIHQPLPYACCDGDGRETMTGGVLQRGAVVWLREPLQRGSASQRVTGFTPTAGVIGVKAQSLFARKPR